jgi:glycosyltransferase involved in cell wall biosynthesis
MEFGLDVRPSLSRPTGVGTYVLNLVDRLPALAPEDRFTYFSASLKERYPERAWPANARLVDRRIPVRALTAAWHRFGWPPIDRLVDRTLDLVHSPTPLLIPARRAKRVVTLHDLFFVKHPDLVGGETRRDFVTLVRDHVQRADGVICVSEYTASEARRLLDVPADKIAVTPHGVDAIFRETPAEAEVDATLRRWRLPRGGILYVGSSEKRKNLVTLVMAYMTLARRKKLQIPPLVLAGPGSDWAQGGSYVGPQIVATGYLERADVRALMAASAALVLPSLEEGFGLPVVEAMAAGLPVVCSRGSALAEVAGDAASLVDPYDVNGLAHAIERVLEDSGLAAELKRRGLERSRAYEWSSTAERTLAFYRKVLGR